MHFHDCTGSPETVRLINATHFSGVESIDRAWNTHIRVLQTLFRYSVRLDISFCVDITITRRTENQTPTEHSHHPSKHRNNPPSIIRQIYHARSSAIEFCLKETQEHLLKHNDLVFPINTLLCCRLHFRWCEQTLQIQYDGACGPGMRRHTSKNTGDGNDAHTLFNRRTWFPCDEDALVLPIVHETKRSSNRMSWLLHPLVLSQASRCHYHSTVQCCDSNPRNWIEPSLTSLCSNQTPKAK